MKSTTKRQWYLTCGAAESRWRSHRSARVILCAVLLVAVGCKRGSPPAPVITDFYAGATTLSAGTSTSLTAVFKNGTGSISPGVGAVGSFSPVSTGALDADRTFVLTVTNKAGKSVTRSLTIVVVPLPVIESFTVSPSGLFAGASASLAWKTSSASSVTLEPGTGATTLEGARTINPTGTTTYTLRAANRLGEARTATVMVSVAESPSAGLGAPPALPPPFAGARFGFAYFVPGFFTLWSQTHFKNNFIQRAFRRDMAVLASLHVDTVKLFYSVSPAIQFTENQGGRLVTAAVDPVMAYYDDACAFAPLIAGSIGDHGITPAVVFMTNEFYTTGPGGWTFLDPGPNWWEFAYARGPGASRMAADIVAWERGIVEAIERSPAGPLVAHYNLHTESAYHHLGDAYRGVEEVVTAAVLQEIPLPAQRRLVDAFLGHWDPATGEFASDAAAVSLATQLRALRQPLEFTEWHVYPAEWPWDHLPTAVEVEEATQAGIAHARELYQGLASDGGAPSIILGEAGIGFVRYRTEPAQADAFLGLWSAAQRDAASMYTWALWDDRPLNSPYGDDIGRIGLGFAPDEPRDVYGSVVEMRSDLPGGDFESGVSGWRAGHATGSGAALTWSPADATAAPTGLHYIRLSVTAPGFAWVCSPAFATQGTRAALSAYLRTNASACQAGLFVHRASSVWSPLPVTTTVATDPAHLRAALEAYSWENPPTTPPYFDPANTFRFYQLQNLAGGVVFETGPDVTGGAVCFAVLAPPGTSAANPITLDLDAVSIHGYAPLLPAPTAQARLAPRAPAR